MLCVVTWCNIHDTENVIHKIANGYFPTKHSFPLGRRKRLFSSLLYVCTFICVVLYKRYWAIVFILIYWNFYCSSLDNTSVWFPVPLNGGVNSTNIHEVSILITNKKVKNKIFRLPSQISNVFLSLALLINLLTHQTVDVPSLLSKFLKTIFKCKNS